MTLTPDIVASWLDRGKPSIRRVGVVERGNTGCAAGSGSRRSAPADPDRDHRRFVDDLHRRDRREHRIAHDRPWSAALSAQQWIMLSYSLAVASLYIAAGALGDRFGRRPLFEIGVAGFAVASMLCGVAPDTSLLIAGRVLQGVFGALLATNSLALLRATFGADSGRAVGQWTAWTGIGALIGPPSEACWWNTHRGAGSSSSTYPQPPPPSSSPSGAGSIEQATEISAGGSNVPASALVTVMFASLTLTLIKASAAGWVAVAWAFGLSFVALVLFVVNERRSSKPLLPLALLHERAFVVANVCTFVVYATLGASMFYLALSPSNRRPWDTHPCSHRWCSSRSASSCSSWQHASDDWPTAMVLASTSRWARS